MMAVRNSQPNCFIDFIHSAGQLRSTGQSDAANPRAALIVSGDSLYGTALSGGSSGVGTVFRVNLDGTGFSTLYSFTATTNNDGYHPRCRLLLSGTTLYGTATHGGSSGNGTVFKVNTDGTGFNNLHSFLGSIQEGSFPTGGLILSNNILYGTTLSGGAFTVGSVFALNTDGSGFNNLFSFSDTTDGAYPWGSLVLLGNTLYGTATEGGEGQNGTVFALATDGSTLRTVYSFTAGSDGVSPTRRPYPCRPDALQYG